VLVSGILQGLGAELAFAILGYSAFGAAAAALAGVLSAPLEWAFEVVAFPASWADVPVLSAFAGGGGWYAEWVLRDKLVYLGAMAVSGAVLAGLVGWLLVRALARAGALSAFPAGQEHREHHAV
jgi:energy-coupling factor transport system permease protein